MPHSTLIRALLEAGRYPHSAPSVELVETHISWVLLTGEYVYKIKKPVDFGFLDFSDLQARRHFCEEELRLNRRLAPQLYLDVVPIRGTPENPRFEGTTPVIEYAVKMRQFDRASTFDRLALEGRLKATHIDHLAETVAGFHNRLAENSDVDAARFARAIDTRARENFSTLATLAKPDETHDILRRMQEWSARTFDRLASRFRQRAEAGFVRECHGDLHLGNIALIDERAVPFDCIEFNQAMRWLDVIDEVAFTVMDLRAHGLPEYGYRFLNRYLQVTGDYKALSLLAFYEVYRALVRAKVALLSRDSRNAGPEQVRALESNFLNYLSIAESRISEPSPQLMITHGLSGCGKSTIAARIAEKLPAIQLRSDIERKRTAHPGQDFENDLYSENMTRFTYQTLADTADSLLDSGISVIVDATFLQKAWRDRFRNLAENKGVRFRILDIQAPVHVLRERITQRLLEKRDPSDADLGVLEMQLKNRNPLTRQEAQTAISIVSDEETALHGLIERLRD